MELARQQAFEMKDKLVRDFREIKNNFPANFPDDFPKIDRSEPTTSSWRTDRQGEEWLQKVDLFFEHLANGLKDTNTSLDEIRDEVFIILRTVNKDGEPTIVDPATCSKEAFVVCIIRKCLKDENLLMQYSTNWKHFGNEFAKYVMDAI